MSATGLEVFDRTLQMTNIWLRDVMEELGPDRHRAYHALRAVLHALRDRLTLDESAHLAAQLPLLVRGIYYESWRPIDQPSRERSQEEFLSHVQDEMTNMAPIDVKAATRCVFSVLSRHVDIGEIKQVRQALPKDIRTLWPEEAIEEGERLRAEARAKRLRQSQEMNPTQSDRNTPLNPN